MKAGLRKNWDYHCTVWKQIATVEVTDSFAMARWPRDADVVTILPLQFLEQ